MNKEIFDFIEIIKEEDNLKDYLKKINIDNTPYKYYIFYSPDDKSININYNALIYKTAKILNKLDIQSDNNILILNICISRILLHEIEHARQEKIMENKNNWEAEILLLSNKREEELKKNKDYTITLYNNNPLEINANINSLEAINNLLSYCKNEQLNNYLFEKIKLKVYSNYKKEGNIITSPANQFFHKDNAINIEEEFIQTFKIMNQTLNNRINYGLIITNMEYNKINRKKVLFYDRKN